MAEPDLDQIAIDLLSLIRRKPGEYFPVEKLSKRLSAEPDIIQSAVQVLCNWEYRLKVRARLGIAFLTAPDLLTDIEVGNSLKTNLFARTHYSYGTVKSTNDIASELAASGAPEGTLITAETQTKGRGRLGRNWYSPPGTGIYLSVILRPRLSPDKAPGLSVMTALALADTLSFYCPGEVRVKWPNDVLINGRKAAGILTELTAERNKINHVIVGIGINVNHGSGHFPVELRPAATSLRRELKRKVKRVELLQRFLLRFEREYTGYKKNGLKRSLTRLRKMSSLLGHTVRVKSGRHVFQGSAVDIDEHGCLVIDRDGKRLPISAGEVTVLKE
jgi:BirA family biotin operon repressor/biotin-[acetyl-CoA-carboxylase] ligase